MLDLDFLRNSSNIQSANTYDYVTLPSLSQMFIKTQTSGEGDVHIYWKRRSGRTTPCEWYNTYPNMVMYSIANKTLPMYVRLRSAYQGNTCNVWGMYTDAYISGNYGVSYSYSFAPLICIA